MFQDFEFKIRTDPKYRSKIYTAVDKIAKTYKDSLKNPSAKKYHQEALVDYLKVSNFNLSPLLGFYYPNYPDFEPYTLRNFPFAHCYYTLNIGPGAFSVFRGSRQIGKSLTTNNLCKIRNKKTGEIKEITIGELFLLAKNNSSRV